MSAADGPPVLRTTSVTGLSYADLDPALYRWAERHGLHVRTRDREWEVRAVTIVDDAGDTYGLSVVPLEDGRIRITAGLRERAQRRTSIPDRKALRLVEEVPLSDLPQALEAGYTRVETWIAGAGHARTPT